MQRLLSNGQSALVQAEGQINAANANALAIQMYRAVMSQATAVIIDMSQVESFDSNGLMALVSAFNLAQQRKKRFSLCSMPAHVKIMFEMAQLDDVFEILPSPAELELV